METQRRWPGILLLGVALLFSSHGQTPVRLPTWVDARQYQAFWLWSGVRPQAVLGQATTLYLLQGEIRPAARGQPGQLVARGVQPVRLPQPVIWLSYRVATLDWSPAVIGQLQQQLMQWRGMGSRVRGIQIDFDAATPKLAGYATFLRQLRSQLPVDCALGITGLLDWSAHGDVAVLNGLQDVVDEVVVQTYRGRFTEANYAAYLPALAKLTLPFRLGLVQYGVWDPDWQRWLMRSPAYRGSVVFLLNPPGGRRE